MRDQLYKKIQQFILGRNLDDSVFSQLALDLWKYQTQSATAYGNFCRATLKSPPRSWLEIPAVPTDAFKQIDIPLTNLQPENITKTFRTSGTTGETKGEHHFLSTELYETSILSAWENLPSMNKTFFLTPSPKEAPDSSLVHMMETIRSSLCPNAQFLMNNGKIDLEPIEKVIRQNLPVTILGTALAFLHILKSTPHSLSLPKGSWCMETGGYKSSGETLEKSELYQSIHDRFQIPIDSIWNEYSMTELSSQFFTSGLNTPHVAPPWTRIRVIHPETGKHVLPGEIGYLEIIDLANIDSVLAIRTQDLAVFHNPTEFALIGRDPSAIPRGCSRSAAEALEENS